MKNFSRAKAACYATNITMAITTNMTPLLFITFRDLYGISYSMLGLLVLINFLTQLAIDLVFSFLSHKINAAAVVRLIPAFTIVGLILFGLAPVMFPAVPYVGLVLGTLLFSASSGFAAVLISPVIAAIPSENPAREMSKLHSIYAWGVVGAVPLIAGYIAIVPKEAWMWMPVALSVVPLVALITFLSAELPPLDTPKSFSDSKRLLGNPTLWLLVFAIFLGGITECTMGQWASGYLEAALGIPKIIGDIFGVATFALMLAVGRTMYAKFGRSIEKVLLVGAITATVCYVTAALIDVPVIGLIACGLSGLAASMLWPGSLVVADDRIANGGVLMYALMASGGDLGASVGPQMVGIIADAIARMESTLGVSEALGTTPDAIGMRVGMLVAAIFPLIASFLFVHVLRTRKKAKAHLSDNSDAPQTAEE